MFAALCALSAGQGLVASVGVGVCLIPTGCFPFRAATVTVQGVAHAWLCDDLEARPVAQAICWL